MLIDNFVEIRSSLQQLIFPLLAKTCPRKGGLKEGENGDVPYACKPQRNSVFQLELRVSRETMKTMGNQPSEVGFSFWDTLSTVHCQKSAEISFHLWAWSQSSTEGGGSCLVVVLQAVWQRKRTGRCPSPPPLFPQAESTEVPRRHGRYHTAPVHVRCAASPG